jgi:hypothetical protein
MKNETSSQSQTLSLIISGEKCVGGGGGGEELEKDERENVL